MSRIIYKTAYQYNDTLMARQLFPSGADKHFQPIDPIA
jgi:hypothetical protein